MKGRPVNFKLREHSKEICALYIKGETAQKIGVKFGVNYNTIFTVLKEQNVQKRNKFNYLLREKSKEIIDLYISNSNADQIGKRFLVDRGTIINVLKENSIPIRNKAEWLNLKRKYTINKKCFNTLSEEACYWLGFLLTDGSISKVGTIELSLKDIDIAHVEKFKTFLEADAPIILKSNNRGYNAGNNNFLAQFRVTSQELCKTLKQYNITTDKTYTAECPEELLMNKHFWRGCVDGDGCLSKTLTGKYSIGLYGTQKLCEQFLAFTQQFYPDCNARVYKSNTIYGVKFSGNNICANICKLLYEDSGVYLQRKKELASEILTNFVRKKDIVISAFDKNGVFLKSFVGIGDCCIEYGINYNTINSSIVRNQLCKGTYYFKREYV